MDDNQFRQLLEFLRLSWKGYRKVRKGVKKRVGRHMKEYGCRSMQQYLGILTQNKEVRNQCEYIMTVSISRFFRDRKLWQVLETRIFPELIKKNRDRILVWSAGCACGEEVYSIKLVWEHMRYSGVNLPVLEITGTDINTLCLKRAEKALYPLSSLKEVPEELREAFFESKSSGRRFRVKSDLRKGITWQKHNFFDDPPSTGFHLIFMRNNLLTYYQKERIVPVFKKIINALSSSGCIITGCHEQLPFQSSAFEPYPSLPYVFQKR